MTDSPLVLTFDCGTQSMRALIFDRDGNIVAKSQYKYPQAYHSPEPGWTEQSMDVYWESLIKTSKEIAEKYPEEMKKIICVTITPFRDSYTCVDKEGNFLRDVIVWLDQREAKCCEPLPLSSRIAFSLVGMTEALNVQRKITKSNWIKENQPEIWAKTYKYISVGCALNYLLTGQMKESVASNIGHVPFDYKNKKWKSTNDIQFSMFGIETEKLCELVEPLGTIGYVTEDASKLTGIPKGLPLIATGSDKGCETLGSGVTDNESASLSFGTSSTIQFSTSKYVEPIPLLPAYPAVIPNLYNPEVQIYRGYWMVTWFLKEFAQKEVVMAKEMGCAAEDLLNKYLEQVPAGCNGLMVQPYWAPQLKQPEGRGAIIGFNSSHTRVHIYRAIIEGIGFALYDAMLNLEKRTGNKIKYVSAAGGGSQSDTICQITADMFGLPVRRIQTYEATGLGSSIAGFVGMGVYKDFDEAMSKMVHYQPLILPDEKNHAVYQKLYNDVYKGTYNRLRPLYLKLYDILKIKN
ncbi:MAG TPA: FGGY-family carbohydrate kinase [Eubacteriales bacterium]|nr:FGGY-family carbohydrate kinase [Eubacteriales bacterium]